MKRKFALLPLLLVLILGLAGCGKKQPTDERAAFRSQLTAEDTAQMLALCDQCMEKLKAGRVDEALASLHLYDDSAHTVLPLSPEKERELRRTFRLFPVVSYTRIYFTFTTEGLNDVKYNIEFFEKEAGDPTPNSIGFMFNPVKVDGQWYLTVKEADQDIDRSRN